MKRLLLTTIILITTVAAFADGFGIKNGPYIQNVTEEGAEIFFTTSQRAAAHPVYGGINDFDSYRREQTMWLQQEIKSKRFRKCTNRIVLMHIPPFVTGDHGSENHAENELVELFTPIFNKAKIDLVLSGHTHRHYSIEPDGKRQFPIVINDNRSVMDLTSDKEGIGVTITEIDGNVTMNKKF